MFFMNQKALDEFVKASGFEVGVGPSVVLVDEGMAICPQSEHKFQS